MAHVAFAHSAHSLPNVSSIILSFIGILAMARPPKTRLPVADSQLAERGRFATLLNKNRKANREATASVTPCSTSFSILVHPSLCAPVVWSRARCDWIWRVRPTIEKRRPIGCANCWRAGAIRNNTDHVATNSLCQGDSHSENGKYH